MRRDLHTMVRLLRPEFGLLPHRFARGTLERQLCGLFGDRDAIDPQVADVVLDEFQRIYALATARAAFLSAARNIYLDRPFGDGGFYPRLSGLRAPALFVWGERDPLIPPGFERHVRHGCPGPSRSCSTAAATCPSSSASSRPRGWSSGSSCGPWSAQRRRAAIWTGASV